jgi:hypothetical protein
MFGCNLHILGVYTSVVKMYSNKRDLQQSNISNMQVASFSSNIRVCLFEIKPAKNVTYDFFLPSKTSYRRKDKGRDGSDKKTRNRR